MAATNSKETPVVFIFEAYDSSNILLAAIILGPPVDGSNDGETAEDTFIGVTNSAGIARIFISNRLGGIEVDHLQYGGGVSAIPVPAAVWLFGTALIGLVGFSKRREAA